MRAAVLIALLFAPACFAGTGFSQALHEIVSRNTGVGVEKSRVSSAETLLLSKRLSFLPSLSLSGSEGNQSDLTLPTKQVTATANLNLFKSGADLAALNSAEASRDFEHYQFDQSVLTAENDGALALIEYLESKMTFDILRQTADYAQQLTNIAELRYKRGLLPLEELNRLQIDQAGDEADVADAQARVNTAQAKLFSLWGKADVASEWPWRLQMSSAKVNQVMSRGILLEQVPAYRSANLLVESEDQKAKQLHRLMLPSLDLTYSTGQFDIDNQWQTGWSTMLTLSIPVFNGLSDYSNYQFQEGRRREAELQLEQVRRDQSSQQKLEQENFRLAYQTAQSRERTLLVAQKLLKTNLARFRSGRMDANDLSVERNRESRASILAIQGWSKAHQALVLLFHAFGQSIQEL